VLTVRWSLAAFAIAVAGHLVAPRVLAQDSLASSLERLGARVENYYRQANRILATETVDIQPVAADMSHDGFGRRLTYEMQTQWDDTAPGSLPEPKTLRKLLLVNGRAPRPRDEPECMDPSPTGEDPLTMLLPSKRKEYIFSLGGSARIAGRPVKTIEFKARSSSRPPVDGTWKDDCVSIPLDGYLKGNIRIDPEGGDVLRLEMRLMGPIDVKPPRNRLRDSGRWRVLERWEQTTDYKPVAFQNPDETSMVPTSIDTITVFRGDGTSRIRITQRFSEYRRFVTESRIVK
jgi:hypothetical protein